MNFSENCERQHNALVKPSRFRGRILNAMLGDNGEMNMKGDTKDLRVIAKEVKDAGMNCNCDLDNYAPERSTGHSLVCRIHKRAMTMKYRPYDIKKSA